MKRLTAKRLSLYLAIASTAIGITWKVSPTFIRVAEVPAKLDTVAAEVRQTANELAELKGEVKTVRHMLQNRMLGYASTNNWRSYE